MTKIKQAVYGIINESQIKGFDVTDKVAPGTRVSNKIMGRDPYPGTKKLLYVVTDEGEFWFNEKEVVCFE